MPATETITSTTTGPAPPGGCAHCCDTAALPRDCPSCGPGGKLPGVLKVTFTGNTDRWATFDSTLTPNGTCGCPPLGVPVTLTHQDPGPTFGGPPLTCSTAFGPTWCGYVGCGAYGTYIYFTCDDTTGGLTGSILRLFHSSTRSSDNVTEVNLGEWYHRDTPDVYQCGDAPLFVFNPATLTPRMGWQMQGGLWPAATTTHPVNPCGYQRPTNFDPPTPHWMHGLTATVSL